MIIFRILPRMESIRDIPVSPSDPVNLAKPLRVLPAVANASRAFVKFFGVGTVKGRIDLSERVIKMVRIQECHRVLAYPTGAHPRQVQDGDVVFISRMTKKPNDHRGRPQKPRKGYMSEVKFPRIPKGFEEMPMPKLGSCGCPCNDLRRTNLGAPAKTY